MIFSNFLRKKTIIEGGTREGPQQLSGWISNTTSVWNNIVAGLQGVRAPVRALLLAPVVIFASWITGVAFHPNPQGFYTGPPRASQSSPIALSGDDVFLVNVNPDVNTVTIFLSGGPNRIGEVAVGRDPVSVAIHPSRPVAYVANSQDGTLSVVDLPTRQLLRTINVGAEPSAVAFSPNGSRLYVANSSSNNLIVINPNNDATIATVDLSPFGTAPRAIGVTNDGDNEDSDETIFVPLFYGGLRAGKTAVEESQDDQREGRVVAVSAASNSILAPNPVLLQPLIDTGFNSNGRLSPGPNQVPDEESTNPQTFLSRTDAFPNQLAAVAIHPTLARAYVVSTGASPNGPFRFNSNSQGLVSVFDTETRLEVTAPQTGADVRRQAPLNLNRGVNLDTALEPRLFFSNPVAMAWRPDGSDAWVVIQNSDVVVRLTVNPSGIPTIGAPLAPGPGQIVRLDLDENLDPGETAGRAPRGIVIDGSGSRAFVYNFTSRTVSAIDITIPTTPTVVATRAVSEIPVDPTVQLGAKLFFTGRGPQGRMSAESWGGCIVCHPNGRSDNVTWMFDAGPRQTIPLDGMFNKANFHDQRVLNWTAVRDSNQDFELNTRGVFGGRGLIDDDRLFLAIGGASNAAPIEQTLIEQFQQFNGAVGTTNDLFGGVQLPQLDFANLRTRRDFAVATLDDARVFIIGGRIGPGQGFVVGDEFAVLEFNPRTNELRTRSAVGFTRRHSLGAAAVKTAGGFRIYAIGGYDSTSASAAPVNTVEEYNPNTNTWRTVASLPTAVAEYGIAVAGGVNTAEPRQLIHVVSGNTGSEASPSVANSNPVQRFQADPAGPGTWTPFALPELTLRRNHGAAAILRVVSSRVFVIGGQDASGATLTNVEEYQAQAVTFVATPHTPLPAARARFGIGSTLTSNQIYVMGGIDGNGADQSAILELTTGANGPTPGPKGTPSGVWVTRGNLSVARRGLQVTTPPGVTNFLPVQSTGRDPRQDAIAAWIAQKVRSARAPVSASNTSAVNGRTLFGQVGLVVPGFSCASCHGGPKWTRSTVDYTEPPSPEIGLGLGNERVIGAELRQTLTQGPNVLINVGTFTLGGGRTNEIRFSGADISQAIAPLGANGFNIPSLLSVPETAPYFYSGLAQTLEEVLNGSQDSFGGVRHHFVLSPAQRADLIEFMRSIDGTTPIFP